MPVATFKQLYKRLMEYAAAFSIIAERTRTMVIMSELEALTLDMARQLSSGRVTASEVTAWLESYGVKAKYQKIVDQYNDRYKELVKQYKTIYI